MNQKAVKKQFSMITSKDDSATASLLGFAIANRVDGANRDEPGETSKSSTKASKEESKDAKDVSGKESKAQGKDSDKEAKPRKLKH